MDFYTIKVHHQSFNDHRIFDRVTTPDTPCYTLGRTQIVSLSLIYLHTTTPNLAQQQGDLRIKENGHNKPER